MSLRPRMAAALELARDAGQLVRRPGGRWTPAGRAEPHADAQSVLALVAHGHLVVVATLPGRSAPARVEPAA